VREGLNVWFLWSGYQGQGVEAPLHFLKVWDLEGWPYPWFHHFSQYTCIYCIFFMTFGYLNRIWTVGTSNTLQTLWRKISLQSVCASRSGTPETMHVILECTIWHTQCTPPAWPRFKRKFRLINLQTWPPSIHGVETF
jgi:hypothetical protein